MFSLAVIRNDLRYNRPVVLLRRVGKAMNDFKDGSEEYSFGIIGEIPKPFPAHMTTLARALIMRHLLEINVMEQSDRNDMMDRFGRTFCKDAIAPAGGEVLFSWKG